MRPALLVALGSVLGALILGLVRLAALPPEHVTHHHANFAVFIDGSRLDLTADRYMEDVARCKADPMRQDPPDRVHLHNRDHDVVHVHAPAATWGHLFANLRFGLGDSWIVTDSGKVLRAENGKTLKFILNGQPEGNVANRPIRSEDRLLVSYGIEREQDIASTQFAAVKANAGEFNGKFDPGGCGAVHEPKLGEKLRRAFWF